MQKIGLVLNRSKQDLGVSNTTFTGFEIDLVGGKLKLAKKTATRIEDDIKLLTTNRMSPGGIKVNIDDLERLIARLNFASAVSHRSRSMLFHLLNAFRTAKHQNTTWAWLSDFALSELRFWENIGDFSIPLGHGQITTVHITSSVYSDASSNAWGFIVYSEDGRHNHSSHGRFKTEEEKARIILEKEAFAFSRAVSSLECNSTVIFYNCDSHQKL